MAVREGLLALLHDGPRYGYQLKTEFETVTGGAWTINVGQIYTTLDRLERDGLVAHDDAEGQKSYSITASGREELGAWWQAVPSDDPPPRDELMLKVLLAIEGGQAHALAIITLQRTALFTALQRSRRKHSPAESAPTSLADSLVTDALIVRAEADLRWLDICEQRVISNERSNP
ncbi:MAG TPA: PadR family transcriptional regulator [Ilumatobacter sp.]|nr:PadR family transcriptional regulator [Ilumatobacter sp.]